MLECIKCTLKCVPYLEITENFKGAPALLQQMHFSFSVICLYIKICHIKSLNSHLFMCNQVQLQCEINSSQQLYLIQRLFCCFLGLIFSSLTLFFNSQFFFIINFLSFSSSTHFNFPFLSPSLLMSSSTFFFLEVIGVAELVNKMNGPWFNRFDEDLATAFSIYCGISIAHVRPDSL